MYRLSDVTKSSTSACLLAVNLCNFSQIALFTAWKLLLIVSSRTLERIVRQA